MAKDFDMQERNAQPGSAGARSARSTLRAAWDLPDDTFITDGFPILLTKLSRIPYDPPKR